MMQPIKGVNGGDFRSNRGGYFQALGLNVLSQIALHRWVPTSLRVRVEGWLYKTVLFPTIKKTYMTTPPQPF